MESKTIIATLKGLVGKLLDDNRMLRTELRKLVAERERIAREKAEQEAKARVQSREIANLFIFISLNYYYLIWKMPYH